MMLGGIFGRAGKKCLVIFELLNQLGDFHINHNLLILCIFIISVPAAVTLNPR